MVGSVDLPYVGPRPGKESHGSNGDGLAMLKGGKGFESEYHRIEQPYHNNLLRGRMNLPAERGWGYWPIGLLKKVTGSPRAGPLQLCTVI